MSKKQDRQGVRTAADLERKYNLGQSVSQAYVQSAIKTSVETSGDEVKRYVDDKVEVLEQAVSEVPQVIYDALEQAKESGEFDGPQGPEGPPGPPGSSGDSSYTLVTVEVDSMNTEEINADKTFDEIETAILSGLDVVVKLVNAESHNIYLQMTAHIPGLEIDFYGYYNGLPLLLQIFAD